MITLAVNALLMYICTFLSSLSHCFPTGNIGALEIDQFTFTPGGHTLTIDFILDSGSRGVFEYEFNGLVREGERMRLVAHSLARYIFIALSRFLLYGQFTSNWCMARALSFVMPVSCTRISLNNHPNS